LFAIRLLTAAGLIAGLLAALLLLDRAAFTVLVGLVLALAAREWARLSGLGRWGAGSYSAGSMLLFAVVAWALWPIDRLDGTPIAVFVATAVFWIALAPIWLACGVAARERRWLRPAGLVVLLPPALAMIAVDPAELLLLLGLVWVADTAAYLTGRAIGRRKLAPTISPGKTWEGAVGALVCVQAYAIACAVLIPRLAGHVRGTAWLPYLAGAALLWAVSIVGDLFESAFKRQAMVKDSGALLPGHGGVLDRIDSATAVLPIGALLLHGMGVT
jgi:phosphatidate cytidylyltransferase